MIDSYFEERRVFPLIPNTKKPAIEVWQETKPGEFLYLPNEYGIALDKTDLVVDIDPRNNGGHSLHYIKTELHIDLLALKTPIIRTGSGGYHFFFKKPAEIKTRKSLKERFPGVDFLSIGAFVVGVGSRHALPPHPLYTWVTKVHPDDALLIPERLLELIANGLYSDAPDEDDIEREDERNTESYRFYLNNMAPIAIEGQRGDETTLMVAFKGRDLGLSASTTVNLMLSEWNDKCMPPWTVADLEQKVNNAFTYAKRGQGYMLPEVEYSTFEAVSVNDTMKTDEDNVTVADPFDPNPAPHPMYTQVPFDAKNETGNARLYLQKYYYGGCMSFSHGTFYVWTGNLWAQRPVSLVEKHLQYTLEDVIQKQSIVAATLRAIQARCHIRFPSQAPDLMFFKNGVLSLSKPGQSLCKPDRRHVNRMVLDYDYDENARCPHFMRFLDASLPSPDDQRLLQEWFGYCLTAETKYQKMMVLIGASRSGKGTLARLMENLIGGGELGHCVAATLRTISRRFGLYPLLGKKAAILADQQDLKVDEMPGAKEALLSIVGCDTMSVECKFEKMPTSVKLSTKITLLCNNFPSLIDNSNALINRLLLIEFKHSFAGKEDVTLDEKLNSERSGIFNWALEGLQRLTKNKAFSCNNVESVKAAVIDATNPVAAFCRDNIASEPGATVAVHDIYERYKIWCNLEGRGPMSKSRFSAALRLNNISSIKRRIPGYEYPIMATINARLKGFEEAGITLTPLALEPDDPLMSLI